MKARMLFTVLALVLMLSGLSSGLAQAATMPSVHVGDVQASASPSASGGYSIQVRVVVHDMLHMAVPGASVGIKWTTPKGIDLFQQTVTDGSGVASFKYTTFYPGTYTVSVSTLSKSGAIYDPRANEKTSASVIIPRAEPSPTR